MCSRTPSGKGRRRCPIMDKMIFSRNTYAPVFPEWKAEHLDGGNFPDAFGQIDVAERLNRTMNAKCAGAEMSTSATHTVW